MANPNLLALTEWKADTQATVATVAEQTCMATPAADHIREVVAIHCANNTATTDWITVVHYIGFAPYTVAYQLKVGAKSIVNVQLGRERYVQADDYLACSCGTDNAVHVTVSFNDLTDA